MPVVLDAAAAGVEGEGDERAVLVGVQLLGVVQLADAVLEGLDVLGQELVALLLGDGGLDAVAVAVGGAVVAETCSCQ